MCRQEKKGYKANKHICACKVNSYRRGVCKSMVIKVRAHTIMSESVLVSDYRTELLGQGCEEHLL